MAEAVSGTDGRSRHPVRRSGAHLQGAGGGGPGRRGAGAAGAQPAHRPRRARRGRRRLRARASRPSCRSSRASTSRPRASRRVAGHDLLTMKEKERVAFRRRSVGFVWQQTSRNLLPYLTASENVAAALAITGEPKGGAARRARVAELLDLLEVVALRRAPARRDVGRRAAAGGDRGRHRQRARGCCWPTSPPANSTTPRARTCSRRCARSTASSA